MICEIISIGDELLIGQIVNTNAAYLCKRLTAQGVEVRWVTTVGDDADDLKRALDTAMKRSDLVLTTGGIGPTHDDITKNVAAEYFGSTLIYHPEIYERLKAAFLKRGVKIAEVNKEQALVPDKARVIDNPVGTAPALLFEVGEKRCFILPGVPQEMKTISEASIFPTLAMPGSTLLQATVRTTGIGESSLFEAIGDVERIEALCKMAFLPKFSGVDIRLMVKGEDPVECENRLAKGLAILNEKIGDYVYAEGDENLEDVVARLLIETARTVAVAESCTGGLLANRLTNISGSSQYFERGVVAYSNQAKMDYLKVPLKTLQRNGAVSEETAKAMAEGVRQASGADFGISTTGIAGPTGGTKDKPVGLVYIGLAKKGETYAKKRLFFKDRLSNKERFVYAALNLLRKELLARNSF